MVMDPVEIFELNKQGTDPGTGLMLARKHKRAHPIVIGAMLRETRKKVVQILVREISKATIVDRTSEKEAKHPLPGHTHEP